MWIIVYKLTKISKHIAVLTGLIHNLSRKKHLLYTQGGHSFYENFRSFKVQVFLLFSI